MNTGKNLLKTYEELIEWRKKAQAMKTVEDEPSRLLREAHNLARSISLGLKEVNEAGRQICNETNDIKYQFESDNSLYIGRESVRPLIELKNNATEVFANVESISTDSNIFAEDIDFGPAFKELEEIRRFANRSNDFLNKLNFITEVISHLENEKGTSSEFQKSSNGIPPTGLSLSEKTVRSESTLSMTGSDPSTSGFNLFENIETNGATSSPISSVKSTEN